MPDPSTNDAVPAAPRLALPDTEHELRQLRANYARVLGENAELRRQLGIPSCPPAAHEAPVQYRKSDLSSDQKVALFRSLFRGREDVFAVRWESKSGKSGYSPSCVNERNRSLCRKPYVKCAECTHREYVPLTEQVVYDHLAGKITVGMYPLLPDETCLFLAADFDKKSWKEDASAFLRSCKALGVQAYLERSRSGNGGHVWIFFDVPVPAYVARRMGCAVLTHAMEARHQIGFDSYDRFFPNQDTMPKGGFGNLIALPLQHQPRTKGNSVFVDETFAPHLDQWAFLSTVVKMPASTVAAIARYAADKGAVVGVRMCAVEEDQDDPWTLPPSRKKPDAPITGPLPKSVKVVSGNQLYIQKEGIPPALMTRIIRLAAFQNPEFYRAQAMRLTTFGKPRVICCAEDFPGHIALPRGTRDELQSLLADHGISMKIENQRHGGSPFAAQFHGVLLPEQQECVDAVMKHDIGVISAATAFGKTVVAAHIIAKRAVNCLVLVHRQQLLDQWRERLAAFLNLPIEQIGEVSGTKKKRNGVLDVAVMQSVNRKGVVNDFVAEYGHVVIDECHHVSAFSFEQVMRQVKARYVLGLTATPTRRDGHHPIIIMQCGPIRFRVSAKEQAGVRPFAHVVIPRITDFVVPDDTGNMAIQDIYAKLATDVGRNHIIAADVKHALDTGRSPIVLTDRTAHAEYFADYCAKDGVCVLLFKGGMGRKHRRNLADEMKAIPDDKPRLIVATGRYIGEGFDDARLDTLFLATPISWRGTLQQYAGRLHRNHSNKREVQVYDYIDARVPMLLKMYQRRLKGYAAIGYEVKQDGETGSVNELPSPVPC